MGRDVEPRSVRMKFFSHTLVKVVCLFALLRYAGTGVLFAEEGAAHEVRVDFSGEGMEMENFWRGTGFTPASKLFREDMRLSLDFMAAIPYGGIRYVRPHWLLNLVRVEDPGGEAPRYDFGRLYEALDILVEREFKPIFEIMGYPAIVGETPQGTRKQGARRWIPDFEDEGAVREWYRFLRTLVRGLEARYGEEELKSWYFECTNEPDGSDHFWDQGIPALLNYWDASSEGVRAVNPDYRFGGPGNAHLLSRTFKQVLAHCEAGTNAITGKKGAKLDFISVHNKALPYDMVENERRVRDYVNRRHPEFAELPFWNNEADPTWGWRERFWWRPTAWYAAFLVQSVDAHSRLLIGRDQVPYGLLINDHGFLGDWYQRSLLARFAEGKDSAGFWLVKKPVFHGMSLLAFAEGRRFAVEGFASDTPGVVLMPLRRDSGEIVLFAANAPDFGNPREAGEDGRFPTSEQRGVHDAAGASLRVELEGMGFSNPRYSRVRIDAGHANPHGRWVEMGRPERLTRETRAELVEVGEPVVLARRENLAKRELHLDMPPSSVSLIVISEGEGKADPIRPAIRKVTSYTAPGGRRQDFVRWRRETDSVVVYQLYVSINGGPYTRATRAPVFELGTVFVWPEGVEVETVEYRVEGVPL